MVVVVLVLMMALNVTVVKRKLGLGLHASVLELQIVLEDVVKTVITIGHWMTLMKKVVY
tara:strand:+ start:49 stop:225 length:177 start_codon:yes stop_codon:yes gene_type:complete